MRGQNFDHGFAQFTPSQNVYFGDVAKHMSTREMRELKEKEYGLIETPKASPGQFLTHFDYNPAYNEY